MLVAVTTPVPVLDGAVKTPRELIEPIVVVHVTVFSVVPPWIAAVNWNFPLGATEAEPGETVTDVIVGLDGLPDEVALPWRVRTMGLCFASVTIDRVPSTLPDLVAANRTAKLLLCRGPRLKGGVMPDMLKPAPVTLA